MNNVSHWTIQDLEITNSNASEEQGINSIQQWEQRNVSDWFNKPLPIRADKLTTGNSRKSGILVEHNRKIGGLTFINLEIHGVNGDMRTKDNGGIFIRTHGSGTPAFFDGLLVDNVYMAPLTCDT